MATLSLSPSLWIIGPNIDGKNLSPGVPTNPSAPWNFTFPKAPGSVHYVHTAYVQSLVGKTLRMVYDITGTGTFKAVDGGVPARVRLFFQRKNDNWSGSGGYQDYRWWSLDGNAELIAPATGVVLTAALDPAKWSNVQGKMGSTRASGFNAACNNVAKVGFTFGASFYGHGAYAGEGAPKFVLKEYSVT